MIHPRKRFYAGGAQSVRGYGENQLGPRVLTIDPFELQKPRVINGGRDTIPGCTEAQIADRSCDLSALTSDKFQPRPVGGRALIEGSVELRFPVWGKLGGAVFLDGAFVGEGALSAVTRGTGALTPGFGARYYSPAGAIRVDLGIRPKIAERLSVLTEVRDSTTGRGRLVSLEQQKIYDPLEVRGGFLGQILNRLQLHLSIGQAF
jgi:outer membrane protein assembly factor BamA